MNAQAFIATTGHGMARAARGANGTWSVTHVLSEHDVRCLAADPLHPHIVYAGTQGQGILRSEDQGHSWHPAGLGDHIVKSLAVSRVDPGAIYAGTKPSMIFVSRDNGTSWTELDSFRHIRSRRFWFSPAEPPFTAYIQGIALSPTDPKVIVVGIEAGAVVRSDDGGQTWSGHRRGALRDSHFAFWQALLPEFTALTVSPGTPDPDGSWPGKRNMGRSAFIPSPAHTR